MNSNGLRRIISFCHEKRECSSKSKSGIGSGQEYIAPEVGGKYKFAPWEGQTDSGYCIECTEGHLLKAATEMRHAVDRYRTAGSMTDGVTEKVRVAMQEVVGIDEDIANLKMAPENVKAELGEIR